MVNKFLYPAGGAETYLFQLGKYWEEQGNEVEIVGIYIPDRWIFTEREFLPM